MKNFFTLFKLGLKRFQSPQKYREMQTFIAQISIDELQLKGVSLENMKVLEVGAGHGGYSTILFKNTRMFVASDVQPHNIFQQEHIPFVELDLLQALPFEANSFDLIYCSSVIEHIPDADTMLREFKRVLKNQGWLYLSFPPFYSLTMIGGHNFKPFHFLGEQTAIKIINYLRGRQIKNYATCYGSWGLYPLTIAEVRHFLNRNQFDIKDTYTRMSQINFAKLPDYLNDLMTWHVCYLAKNQK